MTEAKIDDSALPINQILCGDCVKVMKSLPGSSIDLAMFSPPYYGLRDYGIKGQIGLEDHPSKYIEAMVQVCQEICRLLKKAGSMYIVIGDTYYGSGQHNPIESHGKMVVGSFLSAVSAKDHIPNKKISNWLQPKQLMGIPWRVAIALQEDGWILRNDIIWNKPNHMPSSVTDRLTNAYEHIFHFVKSRRYYYNLEAIRIAHKEGVTRWGGSVMKIPAKHKTNQGLAEALLSEERPWRNPKGKNPSDVVNPDSPKPLAGYKGKFNGFGEDSEKYGSPRARTQRIQKIGSHHGSSLTKGRACYYEDQTIENNPEGKNPSDILKLDTVACPSGPQRWEREGTNRVEARFHPDGKNPNDLWNINTKPFKGAHFAVYPETVCVRPILSSCPRDGIVLDPMCGSGTTLAVAKKLGRKYIGIELNPTYIEIANKRLSEIPEKITSFL